jgi:hypothetical protein
MRSHHAVTTHSPSPAQQCFSITRPPVYHRSPTRHRCLEEGLDHHRWRGSTAIGHQVEQVYYLPYPCEKLSTWWVVHKVNPLEWLYTPGDARYHGTPTLNDDVDEVYQEEELPTSFVVDPGAWFDDLVGDTYDIQMLVVKQKWKPIKKKVRFARLRTRLPDRDVLAFLM